MERSPLSRTYLVFNVTVATVGLGLLVWATLRFGLLVGRGPSGLSSLWADLRFLGPIPVIFLLLFFAARFFKIDIPPNITLSLVLAMQLAAIILMGPVLTAWAAGLAYLGEAGLALYRREVRVPRSLFVSIILFNLGMESLMTLAGGLAYHAAGGVFTPFSFVLSTGSLLRFLAMFVAFKVVNEILMAAGTWFRGNPLARYFEGSRTVLLTETATLPFALLLVEIYTELPQGSLVLFVALFILAGRLVQRLDQTRRDLERAIEDLRKRNKELNALLEVGRAISADIEQKSLLETIHRQCSEILDTSFFFIALYEEGVEELDIAFQIIEGKRQEPRKLRFGEGLTSYVIQRKEHLLIRDIDEEGESVPVSPVSLGDYPTRSWLGMPMTARGEVVGVIALQNRRPGAFDEEDVRLLSGIASQAAISVKNARLHREAIDRILIEQENLELIRLNQKKSEFVNMVAHEFQSPLTTVIGFSNLMREPGRAEQPLREVHKYLDLIHSEARRLSRMVEELLNLSRIRSGKLSLTMQDFDMCALLQETVVAFSLQAEEREQTLETNCQGPCPTWGDSNYIRHVVANLLSNAIKYNPLGASIVIGTTFDGQGHLQVTVRDDGPGIPPEKLERIFEEFFRAENRSTDSPKGIGLGLAITKGIVEAHGGRIWAESEPGRGTAFHFTVPPAGTQHQAVS